MHHTKRHPNNQEVSLDLIIWVGGARQKGPYGRVTWSQLDTVSGSPGDSNFETAFEVTHGDDQRR